jgi:hypothetical protein
MFKLKTKPQTNGTDTKDIAKINASLNPKPPKVWPGRIWRALPWFFIWMSINNIGARIAKLETPYQGLLTLVQVGPDAKPILAMGTEAGTLEDNNVKAFLAEFIPILWRYDKRLPPALGSAVDPGVTLGEEKTKVLTPMFLARAAVNNGIANNLLLQIMQGAPKDLDQGGTGILTNINIAHIEKQGDTRVVTVGALMQVSGPDGTLRSTGPWARKITVAPVAKPRHLLGKSRAEAILNTALLRGLEITAVEDAPEVLP